jgi:hypothetical protein
MGKGRCGMLARPVKRCQGHAACAEEPATAQRHHPRPQQSRGGAAAAAARPPTPEAVAGQQQEGVALAQGKGLHVWRRAHAQLLEGAVAKGARHLDAPCKQKTSMGCGVTAARQKLWTAHPSSSLFWGG